MVHRQICTLEVRTIHAHTHTFRTHSHVQTCTLAQYIRTFDLPTIAVTLTCTPAHTPHQRTHTRQSSTRLQLYSAPQRLRLPRQPPLRHRRLSTATPTTRVPLPIVARANTCSHRISASIISSPVVQPSLCAGFSPVPLVRRGTTFLGCVVGRSGRCSDRQSACDLGAGHSGRYSGHQPAWDLGAGRSGRCSGHQPAWDLGAGRTRQSTPRRLAVDLIYRLATCRVTPTHKLNFHDNS